MNNLIVEFFGFSDSGKTKLWTVRSAHNTNLALGGIRWHGPWRKYTFLPNAATVFDAGCLDEIGAFLVKETSAHKLK